MAKLQWQIGCQLRQIIFESIEFPAAQVQDWHQYPGTACKFKFKNDSDVLRHLERDCGGGTDLDVIEAEKSVKEGQKGCASQFRPGSPVGDVF